MLDIEFYKTRDYEAVKTVLQEAKLFDETWEAEENLKRKIERDPESILVAKESEHVVGCVFIVEDGWNAFIWRLCVAEKHRKKGVGKALMEKAEEIVKARGIKECSLFVDNKNDMLKEWYIKQNYKKTSDWTFMYKKL